MPPAFQPPPPARTPGLGGRHSLAQAVSAERRARPRRRGQGPVNQTPTWPNMMLRSGCLPDVRRAKERGGPDRRTQPSWPHAGPTLAGITFHKISPKQFPQYPRSTQHTGLDPKEAVQRARPARQWRAARRRRRRMRAPPDPELPTRGTRSVPGCALPACVGEGAPMAARPASAMAPDHTPGFAAATPQPGGSSAAATRRPEPGALAHLQALPLAVGLHHGR
jgi:hypothetical protein